MSLLQIRFTQWLAALVAVGAAQACYYYYYVEDPTNFAYRYCSVGCGQAVLPENPAYFSCCIPLSSGAPTPTTCTALASSASEAGTVCSWSTVATHDMPTSFPTPTYSYATPATSNAASSEPCETVWITETASPTGCQAQTTVIPPMTSRIEALATSSSEYSSLASVAPTSNVVSDFHRSTPAPVSTPPVSTTLATTAASTAESTSEGGTCGCPLTGDQGAIEPSGYLKRDGLCECPSPTVSPSHTEIDQQPCECRTGDQGALSPSGWRKRGEPCVCPTGLPSTSIPTPAQTTSIINSDSCVCRDGSQGANRPSGYAKRGPGDDCLCETTSLPVLTTTAPPTPTVTDGCNCPEVDRQDDGNPGALPPGSHKKRDGTCVCQDLPLATSSIQCDCHPRVGTQGATAPSGVPFRRDSGLDDPSCDCETSLGLDNVLPTVSLAANEQFDGVGAARVKRALPGTDFVPEPDVTAAPPSAGFVNGMTATTSLVKALPTYNVDDTNAAPTISAAAPCIITMTTTIAASCTSLAPDSSATGNPDGGLVSDVDQMDFANHAVVGSNGGDHHDSDEECEEDYELEV